MTIIPDVVVFVTSNAPSLFFAACCIFFAAAVLNHIRNRMVPKTKKLDFSVNEEGLIPEARFDEDKHDRDIIEKPV